MIVSWRKRLRLFWRGLSLAQQFAFASLAVLLATMLVAGWWIGREIESGVSQSSGATTALYVRSFVAPEVQELARQGELSANSVAVLKHLLKETPLGERIVSIKIWGPKGRVVYSNQPTIIGKTFPVTDELKAAWHGEISSQLSQLGDEEDFAESQIGQPLLEIYTPVFETGSRKVIAVAEFYELASDLERQISRARRNGWLVIIAITAAVFTLLFGIVRRGSTTIAGQQAELEARVRDLSELLSRNDELHTRIQKASYRAAELHEKLLRRVSAELHDGPAQGIGFALLRLDALKAQIDGKLGSDSASAPDLDRIRGSLRDSLQEIRHLCSGMALPELDNLSLEQAVRRVIRAHERRSETHVTAVFGELPERVEPSLKIAIYRFIQEALTNAYRHGGGLGQNISVRFESAAIAVVVSDAGPGFDQPPDEINGDHLGIPGMRKRVESFGGTFDIDSRRDRGTRVTGRFPVGTREFAHV